MRVISGKARGVILKTPEGMQTRPTADRVKEALFSILQFDLPGTKVLDLLSAKAETMFSYTFQLSAWTDLRLSQKATQLSSKLLTALKVLRLQT